jgi:chemotaxis protein MotB
MKAIKFSAIIILTAGFFLLSGCTDAKVENLKLKNAAQEKQLNELRAEKAALELELSQLKQQLDDTNNISSVNVTSLKQQVAALEEELERKRQIIDTMQKQMLFGVALPAELNTMLEDFANSESIVTYDSAKGLVKFNSDLLFESGNDTVASSAREAIKSLCTILQTEQAQEFDIIIAGHTDDMRIAKPATRAKHPTNWHLSAHRAISVLEQMTKNDINPQRLSIRGFGEFRPVAENKPNKKGNPQNRRVEIYIVPKGT